MSRVAERGEIVPGRRAVRELLAARTRGVKKLFVSRDLDDAPIIDEILDLAGAAGVRVDRVDTERVQTEARNESPQGVVALAEPVAPADLDDLLARPDAFLVALDGLTDPRNLGAVLRTAEVAGATGAIVPKRRSALLVPAAVKAAAGAIEHLPLAFVGGIPAALEQASRAGVWSVGLDADGDQTVYDLEIADRPLILVLGAEGAGLARLTRDRCDLVAGIPMRGSIESLNVSAAAAVACFEIARRRAIRP